MNNNYFSQIWMNNNNFSRFRSIVKIRHFRLLCLVRMERKTNWKLTIKSRKRKLFYFFTIIVLLLNTPKIITHIFKFSYIFKQFDENLLILCTLVVWVYHLTRTWTLEQLWDKNSVIADILFYITADLGSASYYADSYGKKRLFKIDFDAVGIRANLLLW